MQRSIAGLLLSLAALACSPPRADHLVLVSLDTVRRDHLPTYGYARATAPAIDALAQQAVVFDGAIAQHTNTVPSHASMFTGLYPITHGSLSNARPLDDEHPTLAGVLSAAGFRTGGFVGGAVMRGAESGLARGFGVWDDTFEERPLRRDAAATVARALAWWGAPPTGERVFLFVHLYDAHGPYLPRGEYAKLFLSLDPGPKLEHIPHYQQVRDESGRVQRHLNGYVDRYDAMIRAMDDALAPLFAALDLERTALVILADHGESLGERDHVLDHGGQVVDEQIRIPLIVAAPGLAPGRVARTVQTVDLLPTLLDLLEVAPPADLAVQGRSLLPLLRGAAAGPERPAFASSLSLAPRHLERSAGFRPGGQIHAVRTPRWKLVLFPGADGDFAALYDLERDPGERRDLAARAPRVAQAHRSLLDAWLARSRAEPTPPLDDPELRERLRALGYTEP